MFCHAASAESRVEEEGVRDVGLTSGGMTSVPIHFRGSREVEMKSRKADLGF